MHKTKEEKDGNGIKKERKVGVERGGEGREGKRREGNDESRNGSMTFFSRTRMEVRGQPSELNPFLPLKAAGMEFGFQAACKISQIRLSTSKAI